MILQAKHIIFLLLMFVSPAWIGCVRGTRPAARVTYLDISPGSTPKGNWSSQDVLLLRRIDVESPFDGRRLIYRTKSETWEIDYYVRFIASPGDLLTDHLETWLDGISLFRAVIEPGSTAEYRYVLEGQVSKLFGDYSNPDQPKAVLEAAFVLVDDKTGSGQIAFEKQYRCDVPLEASNAMALTKSWGEALRSLLLQLGTDLQSTMRNRDGL